MKVQNQAPVQTPSASTTAPASNTAATARAEGSSATPAASGLASGAAGQLGNRFNKDEFIQGGPNKPGPAIIDCFPFPPQPKDTMSLKDHVTASKLPETLSNPLNDDLLKAGDKDQQLSRDDQNVWRGPEGQPLSQVRLEDGTTAYVDPNTNQYYLTDEKGFFGQVNALGPLDLPEGAQFSNSYFSDADARSIEKDAARGTPFPRPFPDPLPFPRPFPPIEPKPLPFPIEPGPKFPPFEPRPLPFPIDPMPKLPDPWGPLPKLDPKDFLA